MWTSSLQFCFHFYMQLLRGPVAQFLNFFKLAKLIFLNKRLRIVMILVKIGTSLPIIIFSCVTWNSFLLDTVLET